MGVHPNFTASITAAAMAALVPGAGPPPTTIPMRFIAMAAPWLTRSGAETALHFHLDLARQVHLGKPDVSVFVTFHVLQLGQLRGIQLFDESLRYDHHAMVLSQRTSLDDRPFDNVAHRGEGNGGGCEL